MNHEILIETEVDGAEPYAGLLRRVIPAALEAEGVSFPCEVDVLFTDDEGIHAINLEQRGVDRPTDVLSFPMFQLTPGAPPTLDDVEADPGTGLVPLGDMVLSLERAEAQGRSTATARSGGGLPGRPLGAPPAGLRPPG
ncbi:MAG: rRNA maturation RNase YbeY [Flavonifractor plautii]